WLDSLATAGLQQQDEKRINGPAPRPVLPTICQAIVELIARLPPQRCPRWQKWICSEKQGRITSICRTLHSGGANEDRDAQDPRCAGRRHGWNARQHLVR